MSKNGAGFDPAIEDVPGEIEEIEDIKILEVVLVPKGTEWFVHVKFSKGDAREYTLDDYNKTIPVPIIPPHDITKPFILPI